MILKTLNGVMQVLKRHIKHQSETTLEIKLVRLTEVCAKVLSEKTSYKHHCYYPMLLMRTTKTAVCLQTKAIFHHLYLVF